MDNRLSHWSALGVVLAVSCSAAVANVGCIIVEGSQGGSGGTTATAGSGGATGGTGGATGGAGGGECPADAPQFAGSETCAGEGLHCEYGQECCDGGCFASYVCDCQSGTWSCFYTDACFGACDPGIPDDDADGDGYTENLGDCDDCDALVNPGAAEIPENLADDDCDGLADIADPDVQPCDGALAIDSADPMDAVKALGLCDVDANGDPKFLKEAVWVLADGTVPGADVDMAKYHLGHGLLDHFGANDVPREGARMLALSSGTARNKDEDGFFSRNFDKGYSSLPPTSFTGDNPACPGVHVPTESVQDAAALEITFQAPTNAQGLEFSFNYRTYEFPQFACTQFNDSFWVNFATAETDTNLSFDSFGNTVGVNNVFLTQCECPPGGPGTCGDAAAGLAFDCQARDLLDGTDFDGNTNPAPTYAGWTNGGTKWLTTMAPVTPGQTFKIRFEVFDSGVVNGATDHNVDSTAMVDRFRWRATPTENVTQPAN